MKRYTILIALILAYALTSGQVISTKIIAFASDCYLCQGYSLSCTLEETINEAFLKGKDQVTRELQQSYLNKISQLPVQSLPSEYSIETSQNPAESYFIVTIDTDREQGQFKMMLYDMFDIKVDKTILEPELNTKKIDVNQFSYDMFLLTISDDENRFILQSTIH